MDYEIYESENEYPWDDRVYDDGGEKEFLSAYDEAYWKRVKEDNSEQPSKKEGPSR